MVSSIAPPARAIETTMQDITSVRAILVIGDETTRKAQDSVFLALGVPEAIGVTLRLTLNGLIDYVLDCCQPTDLLDKRGDIEAAHAQIKASKEKVTSYLLPFFPTLTT
ncbi:hypothetical protein [Pajaroellobacter abortibovis]|nr:hypothetical protein [Pajaroellobacter abortibovis]